jgi:hypothetical protein
MFSQLNTIKKNLYLDAINVHHIYPRQDKNLFLVQGFKKIGIPHDCNENKTSRV